MTSVIVLCGGLGTRMGKAAAHRQKTMSEVCGTPLLELVLTQVCAAVPAPAPVVLLTGHRGTDVAAAVPDWHTRVDARIRAVAEFAPGTVGVLQLAERLPAPILIIAGNVLLDYSRLLPPMLQQWATDGRPVTAGKANILRQVEDSDPDDPFVRGLRDRYSEIDGERQTALAAVSDLDVAEAAQPARPAADTVDLMDALPYLEMNLALAPEPLLRKLFELTQLVIELHDDSDHITLTIRLPCGLLAKGSGRSRKDHRRHAPPHPQGEEEAGRCYPCCRSRS